MPLRVYVDHCVATATPDAEAPLRYDFIEHFGWAPQAKLKMAPIWNNKMKIVIVKMIMFFFFLVISFPTFVFLCCPNRCLADAYLTNSTSRFLPRVEEHKLRFQLDAFRFYQEPGNQVGKLYHYIYTCICFCIQGLLSKVYPAVRLLSVLCSVQ